MDEIFDRDVMSIPPAGDSSYTLSQLLGSLEGDSRNLMKMQFVKWRG